MQRIAYAYATSKRPEACISASAGPPPTRPAARLAACPQLAAPAAPAPVDPSQEFFVRVDNGEFVAGCQRFILSGCNQWEVSP